MRDCYNVTSTINNVENLISSLTTINNVENLISSLTDTIQSNTLLGLRLKRFTAIADCKLGHHDTNSLPIQPHSPQVDPLEELSIASQMCTHRPPTIENQLVATFIIYYVY